MRLMNEQESAGSGMFLLGAVAGALVGASVALLMAPKPGAEIRSDLNASFNSLRDAAARRYREMADRAGVQLENIEEKADQLADQLESSAREALDMASAKVHSVTGSTKSARDANGAPRHT
ncbi:MAG: YtxH domain-containing protein [Acidobacteriota bacterium]|nr:YtxH domain-containing protein [Acidobacteriota bacterium]